MPICLDARSNDATLFHITPLLFFGKQADVLPPLVSAPYKFDLIPRFDLGEDFARGWDKLPAEIKVHILSFNLVSDENITEKQHKKMLPTLLHHLRCTPEIAGLAEEIYYGMNAFELKDCYGDYCQAWPVQNAWRRIQNVHVVVRNLEDAEGFYRARWFVTKRDLFSSLRRVEIIVDWDSRIKAPHRPNTVKGWVQLLSPHMMDHRQKYSVKGKITFKPAPKETELAEDIEMYLGNWNVFKS